MKANNVVNGLSAIDKYHTDELDEKLETHAVREGKDVDLMTAMRHTNKDEEDDDKLEFVDSKDTTEVIKSSIKSGKKKTFVEKGTGTRVNINIEKLDN